MESIFENTTTLTRQNLTEMARATVPRWSLLVGIIPAVLAVAAAIWDLARRGISLWAGLLLLAAFALVMTTYGAPARVALKIAKRNFKKYGSEVTATLCFYEDKVIVHNHQDGHCPQPSGRFRGGPSLRADFSRPSEPPALSAGAPRQNRPAAGEDRLHQGRPGGIPRLYAAEMPRPGRLLRKARKKDLHPGKKRAILFLVKSVI